jgi:hypothetical protein
MSPEELGPEGDCAGEGSTRTVKDRPIFSSERMLHKDYDHKGLAEKNFWS